MNVNFIIPCFNEEKIIYESIKYLIEKIKKNKYLNEFEIILVDDGSSDNTWPIIQKLNLEDNRIKGIKLLKNYGHLSALNAGFRENNLDYICMLDADFMLEYPKDMVEKLLEKMSTNQYDIIQVARDQYHANFLKATSSKLFYFIFNFLSNVKIIVSAPDFRIMNYKVFKKLNSLNHKIFFRREIVAFDFKIKILSFDQSSVRKSKFTFLKMLSFALESLIFNTGLLKKKSDFIVKERIK
tara:strand:- start:3698 stop:4417 length:720 start_codon:yes stop_codon:yes gene_type:complete